MADPKIKSKIIGYQFENKAHSGYLCYDTNHDSSRPVVLIAHAWAGQSDFERKQAELIASWGFCAFAIDLYGEGILGKNTEENQTLMSPFLERRELITIKINLAVQALKGERTAATEAMAAIGFCFGGLCVLDCARENLANLAGVVSVHGLLKPIEAGSKTSKEMDASVLVLNGHDDPMVSAQDINTFHNEMDSRQADWQFHQFSKTKHGFSDPSCDSPKLGARYHEKSAQRSIKLTKNFLQEILL